MKEHTANVSGEFYVVTTSGMADQRHRIIKNSATVAIFDVHGDICRGDSSPQGLYWQGTRFLSHLVLSLEGKRLLLLSSDVTRDNHLVTVDLTNPDLISDSKPMVTRGTLHVFRSKFLWEGSCYEKFRFKNFGLHPISFHFQIEFEADFADIFEIRGLERHKRGKYEPVRISENMLEFPYLGLDGILRRTRIDFSVQPRSIYKKGADYQISLDVNEELEFEVVVSYLAEQSSRLSIGPYEKAYFKASELLKRNAQRESSIVTSNYQFNALLERAESDLQMLLTNENGMQYPYAGIPWFCTPFGRDGLITALETLWLIPEISRDVLAYLASKQSSSTNKNQDSEPGKILHELRMGEMTNCGELPFSQYYGSADATPLFVILAGKYFRRTGDMLFIKSIWPNIERALHWMDHFGDLEKDGFVEYQQRSEHGIENQAWKDSFDSVFHEDGTLAESPIAICEVQAYVYAAKKEAAFLAESMKNHKMAAALHQQAEDLQQKFEKTFWDEEIGCYVLALDAQKRPCRVKASNMGHCLFAQIASFDRARRTGNLLMDESFFSGWGIRTLAAGQPRYNPMSYHNGSVWPHDNALIAEGFSKYGFNQYAATILDAFFQMSQYTELNRFPELFCGFKRRKYQGPTLYPVACSPQAWAAASVFLLLKSCLGLQIDAPENKISFTSPCLPECLDTVRIRNLKVKGAVVDFLVRRHREDVTIRVIERSENIRLIIER
jgi:glycogen debranching enzyme